MKNLSLDNSIFLVNPVSGKISLKKKLNIISSIIRGTKGEILISNSLKDAADKAKKNINNKKVIVACGGDGLINIVAQEVILNNGVMAILPFGRGNDFANSLNINSPDDLQKTFMSPAIIKARYLLVSFNNYNKISLTCAGVGLLSEAAYRASKIPFLKGVLLYAIATIISLINLKNHKYEINYDSKVINEELLILAAAASQYTGGGMHIAPDAYKSKTKLNLLYARKVNHLNAISLLVGVLRGTHLSHDAVKNLHTQNIVITTKSKNAWANLVYGDGEYLGNLPVNIELGKNNLNVLVPKLQN